MAAGSRRNKSCVRCYRDRKGCDGERPCGRCVANGDEENCGDQTRKPSKKRKAAEAAKEQENGGETGDPATNPTRKKRRTVGDVSAGFETHIHTMDNTGDDIAIAKINPELLKPTRGTISMEIENGNENDVATTARREHNLSVSPRMGHDLPFTPNPSSEYHQADSHAMWDGSFSTGDSSEVNEEGCERHVIQSILDTYPGGAKVRLMLR